MELLFGHKLVIQMSFLKVYSPSSPQPAITLALSYTVHGRVFNLMPFQQHLAQLLREDLAKVAWKRHRKSHSSLLASLKEEMSRDCHANFHKKRDCHQYYPLKLKFRGIKIANSTHSSLWLSIIERHIPVYLSSTHQVTRPLYLCLAYFDPFSATSGRFLLRSLVMGCSPNKTHLKKN